MERAFRGVWIPAEIYLDGRLTPTEVCLLAEIESLDTGDGCYADNKYLADFGRCDVRTVSRHIAHLRELGLINVTTEGGLRRLHRLPSPKIERNETVKRFIPPTVEEIKAYCEERKNGIDAERFFDYYAARGWLVAKGVKMYDWKACVRSWETSDKNKQQRKPSQAHEFSEHHYSEEKLKSACVNFDEYEDTI